MKPLKQNKLVFTNKCGCLVDYSLLEKAMLWFADDILKPNRIIYLHGVYPGVSIFNKKIHVHRLIRSFMENRALETKEFVHHINHNKLDARVENLEIITDSIHQSLHNKGKVISAEHRLKMSVNGKKRKGIKVAKHRPDITPKMVYDLRISGHSFNKIAVSLKLDWACVKSRYKEYLTVNQNPELL